MLRAAVVTIGLMFISLVGGCATISSSPEQVRIESSPPGAHIAYKSPDNETGDVTPATLKVKRKGGWYKFHLTLGGYRPTTLMVPARINGRYFGNFVVGGALGLSVDLISGAARKIGYDVLHVNLEPGDEPRTLYLSHLGNNTYLWRAGSRRGEPVDAYGVTIEEWREMREQEKRRGSFAPYD